MNDLAPAGDSLAAVLHIHSVGDNPPFQIVPLIHREGSCTSPAELMEARVTWVRKVGYSVVTDDVSADFFPYNVVIRLHAGGTEDRDRDYLAHIRGLPASP